MGDFLALNLSGFSIHHHQTCLEMSHCTMMRFDKKLRPVIIKDSFFQKILMHLSYPWRILVIFPYKPMTCQTLGHPHFLSKFKSLASHKISSSSKKFSSTVRRYEECISTYRIKATFSKLTTRIFFVNQTRLRTYIL